MSSLGNFVKRLRDIMRNDAGINGDAQRIEQMAWMLFLKVYAAKEIERQNKKLKYDDIEDKTRGNGIVPNGKQTTPTTNDSIF